MFAPGFTCEPGRFPHVPEPFPDDSGLIPVLPDARPVLPGVFPMLPRPFPMHIVLCT